MPATSRLRAALPLLGIAAAAVLFRLPALLHAGLSRDQANVYVELTATTFGAFMHRVELVEYHPPLYFVLEYLWSRVFGVSEIAMTSLPLLFSIATVPALFALGEALGTPRSGYIAAAIFAVSPVAVESSGNYVYPVIAMLAAFLAVAVLRARECPQSYWRLLFVFVSSVLAVYSHYIALLYVAMLIVWMLIESRWRPGCERIAAALFLGLCTFTFWLPVLLRQESVGLPYRTPATWGFKMIFIQNVLLHAIPSPAESLQIVALALLIGMSFSVARSRNFAQAFALLSCMLVLMLAAAQRDLFVERYVFVLYPLFCAYAAFVVDQFMHAAAMKRMAAIVTVLAALFIASDAIYAWQTAAEPKSGIQTFAAVSFTGDGTASTLYVVAPDYLASTFYYYTRKERPAFVGFARADEPEFFRLANYSGIWRARGVVGAASRRIAMLARSYRYVDFVADDQIAQQTGSVPYDKIWKLLRDLRGRYRLISAQHFPGRDEDIMVYRLAVPVKNALHRSKIGAWQLAGPPA